MTVAWGPADRVASSGALSRDELEVLIRVERALAAASTRAAIIAALEQALVPEVADRCLVTRAANDRECRPQAWPEVTPELLPRAVPDELARAALGGASVTSLASAPVGPHGQLVLATCTAGRPLSDSRLPLIAVIAHDAGSALDRAAALARLGAERDAAAAALAEAQATAARLEAVLDAIPAVIRVVDPEGRFLLVNREWERRFGQERAQVRGRRLHDVLPAEAAAALWHDDRRVLATGQATETTNEVPQADGSRRYLTRKAPLRDLQGAVCGVSSVSMDVTERLAMEQALRASEDRFSRIFHGNPAGVAITDRDGRFIDANEACLRLLGRTREELLGHTAAEVGLWPSAESRAQAFARVDHGVARGVEVQFVHRSGERRHLLMFAEPIQVDDQPCLLSIGIDVTEHRRLEEQLRQRHKMEAIGHLAGGVAHDFNNILTTIRGYADLMLERLAADDPTQEWATRIHRAATRAASLTGQLLVFGRKQATQAVVLDLNLVIAELDGLLRRLLGEDVALTLELAPDLGRVRADAALIEQVLLNLTANARDAMPAGGRLTITTANAVVDETRVVRLTVRDDGVGMTEEQRSHAFEPFYTTKEPGKGTGLGLSSVYSIIEQSGGAIDVESAPGAGAAFRIRLPSVDEPAAAAPSADATPGPGGTETVLVVEDDDDVRSFLRHVLAAAGYRLLEAADGAAALALEAAHSGPIDALVSDVVMPRMSGPGLASRLRERRPDLAVVLLSGYPGDHLGADGELDLLRKPLTSSALLSRLRAALDRR